MWKSWESFLVFIYFAFNQPDLFLSEGFSEMFFVLWLISPLLLVQYLDIFIGLLFASAVDFDGSGCLTVFAQISSTKSGE